MNQDGNAERELLFGLLALQVGLVEQENLLAAFRSWTQDRTRSLADELAKCGTLSAEDQSTLEQLVERHMARHGGDAERSLAALRANPPGSPAENGGASWSLETIAHIPDASRLRSRAEATGVELPGPAAYGGRFRILRPHASGGLGIVSVALDSDLNREVALKKMRPELADDPDSRGRFLLEAEVTGLLEHPGVVPVYGLGTDGAGRPFYAMRFVRGESLREAAERFHQEGADGGPERRTRSLEWRHLLKRFVDVCNVIAYAHSRGVVHRDLKPANVLLGPFGETLVVDWGLAKVIGSETIESKGEKSLRPASVSGFHETMAGMAVGTPAYMSPEQAEGRTDAAGPAVDVYGLGATLYHMLTGYAPLDDADMATLLRRARGGEVPPARQRNRMAPPALEAVCRKAMALRPQDRYASPRELAEEIEHWLADEPVSVHRGSLSTRLTRWGRRHRTAAVGIAALLVAAVAALSIATVLIRREQARTEGRRLEAVANFRDAEVQRGIAAERSREATDKAAALERQLYLNRIRLAQQECSGEVELAERLLDACPVPLRDWEWRHLKRLCHLELMTLPVTTRHVTSLAFSPDGSRIATGSGWANYDARSNDRADLRLWDSQTGRPVGSFQGARGSIHGLAFSPDGSRLAAVGGWYEPRQGWLIVYDAQTGHVLYERKHDNVLGMGVTFSPNGRQIAVAFGAMSSDLVGFIRIYDAKTGTEGPIATGQAGSTNALAYSVDGRRLALAGSGTVEIWDAERMSRLEVLQGHRNWVYGVSFYGAGDRLASAGWDRLVKLWDLSAGRELMTMTGHSGLVTALAFRPDGHELATGGEDKQVKVWDVTEGRELGARHGHTGAIRDVAYHPDGQRLASASDDGTVRIWNANPDSQTTLRGHTGWVHALAFRPGDRWELATGSGDGTLKIWNRSTGTLLRTLTGHRGWIFSVAYDTLGTTIATAGQDGQVRLWDSSTDRAIRTLTHSKTTGARAVSFQPGGHLLASAGEDSVVRIWDRITGKEAVAPVEHSKGIVHAALFSPNGRLLASAGDDHTIRLWDPRTGRPIRTLRGHTEPVLDLAFNADGSLLASASADRSVRVWQVSTGRQRQVLRGHTGSVLGVAFSPDGHRLVSGGLDRTVRLWDPATGDEVLALRGHGNVVVDLAFSTDGRWLASGSADWTAIVWDAPR
jgi:WD40 repeat protein/serine/threonine protein kinase